MAPYDCWVSPVRVMKIMKLLLKDNGTSMNPYCSWCSCATFDAKNQEVDLIVGEGLNDHEQITSGGSGDRDICTLEMSAFALFRCSFFRSFIPCRQSQKGTGTSGQNRYGFTVEETLFPNLPFDAFQGTASQCLSP